MIVIAGTECVPSRRYTKAKRIETLAINKFRQNGLGINFNDLLSKGLAEHKPQAQGTLKHCLRSGILFTSYNRKPQRYYPTCLKSEILNKNIPVGPMGVGLFKTPLFQDKCKDNRSIGFNHGLDSAIAYSHWKDTYYLCYPKPRCIFISSISKQEFFLNATRRLFFLLALGIKARSTKPLLVVLLLGIASIQMEQLSYQQRADNNPLPLATEFDCSHSWHFLAR